MKIKSLIAVSVLALSIVSCKKESGATGGGIALTYRMQATNTSATINREINTSAANVQWTSGSATANQLKFEAKNGSAEVEFKSFVQQSINLFNASTAFGNISLPAGTYSEVEFYAQLSPANNNPALELKGTYTNGASTSNITFRVNESVLFKAEKNNVAITSGANNVVVPVNLTLIMQGVSQAALNAATTNNGEIIISSTSNANLYNIMVNNLRNLHDEAEFHH